MDSHGFRDAEIIFTEWNNGSFLTHQEVTDVSHAADTSYIFLSGQRSPTDMMMYYLISRTSRFNRVISPDMEVFPTFYSFVMFGKLYELGTEVESGEYNPDEDFAMIAAKNDKKAGIAFANISYTVKELDFTFKGAEKFDAYKVYIMDHQKSPSIPSVLFEGKVADGLKISLTGRKCIGYIEFE